MKLTIMDARDCPVSKPDLAQYKTDEYVHLSGEAAGGLRNIGILNQEFGPTSRNYAKRNINKFLSPKSWEACNQGTGKYPISSYVITYFLDSTGEITPYSHSTVGAGIFVLVSDLAAIESFLSTYFPAIEIEDTRSSASSYSM